MLRFQGSFAAVLKPIFARKYSLELGSIWKALAEIYAMHAFAPFWNRIAQFPDLEIFLKFCILQKILPIFSQMLLFFRQIDYFSLQISRKLPEFREILNHFQISMNLISEQVCFNFSSRSLSFSLNSFSNIFHFRFNFQIVFSLAGPAPR